MRRLQKRLYDCHFYVVSVAGETPTSEERENVTSLVQRAHHARRTAENVAKHLLQKLDRSCGIHIPQTGSPRPWEDLSSNSRTTRYVYVYSLAFWELLVCEKGKVRSFLHTCTLLQTLSLENTCVWNRHLVLILNSVYYVYRSVNSRNLN